jgi:hypothetical protein
MPSDRADPQTRYFYNLDKYDDNEPTLQFIDWLRHRINAEQEQNIDWDNKKIKF